MLDIPSTDQLSSSSNLRHVSRQARCMGHPMVLQIRSYQLAGGQVGGNSVSDCRWGVVAMGSKISANGLRLHIFNRKNMDK